MAQVVGTIISVTGLVGIMKPGGPLYGAKVGDRVEENDVVRTLDPDSSLVLELDGGREIVLGGDEEVLVDQSVFAAVEEGESVDVEALQAALAEDTVPPAEAVEEGEVEALQAALEEGIDPSDLGETAAGEEAPTDPAQSDVPYAERGDARGSVEATLRPTEFTTESPTFTVENNEDNLAPEAFPDTEETDEESAVTIDVLANDVDPNVGDTLTITSVAVTDGLGSASIVNGQIVYDPGDDYQYLADGESAQVLLNYTIEDSLGQASGSTVTITVTGTNDAPVIHVGESDLVGEVTEITDGAEGENIVNVTDSGDVTFSDIDLSDTHTVGITELGEEYYGELTALVDNDTNTVTWTFSVPDADLDHLSAEDSFTQSYDLTVDDGHGGTATETVVVTINGTNDAPEATDDAVTTAEDTTVILGLDDFGTYSDVENTPIASVKITTVEDNGSLEWYNGSSWVAVAAGQVISAADIDDGYLRFVPDANEFGSPYTTVGFQVSDGTDFSLDSYTLTVNVNSVNDAPVSTDDAVTTDEDTTVILGLDDFGTYSDVENTPIASVKITTVEDNGSLEWYNGSSWVAVAAGQVISAADIDDGYLRFVPDANEFGSPYTTVGFQVSDGTDFSLDSYTLTVNVNSVNDAPEADDDLGATDIITYESIWNYDLNAGNDYSNEGVTITAINPNPENPDPVDRMGPTMGIDGESDTDSSQMLNPEKTNADDPDNNFQPEGIRFEFDQPLKVVVVDFGNFNQHDTASWTVYDVDGNMYSGTFEYSGNPNDLYTIDADALGADVYFDTVEILNTDEVDGNSFSIDQLLGSASGTDYYTKGSPLYFTEEDLISNDQDIDGDLLNVAGLDSVGDFEATTAMGATVTLDSDGNVLYDPSSIDWTEWDPSGSYTDSFTYWISDGEGGSDSATVEVSLIPSVNPGAYSGDILLIDDYTMGDSQSIDFGEIAGLASDISYIDLKDGDEGKALLNLSPESVLNLTDTSNILHIDGESGDSVLYDGSGWSEAGGTADYNTYTADVGGETVTLHIDTDIDVDIIP